MKIFNTINIECGNRKAYKNSQFLIAVWVILEDLCGYSILRVNKMASFMTKGLCFRTKESTLPNYSHNLSEMV